jgi:hypothetical protein
MTLNANGVIMLSVGLYLLYAKCHYAECRYAECCGASLWSWVGLVFISF